MGVASPSSPCGRPFGNALGEGGEATITDGQNVSERVPTMYGETRRTENQQTSRNSDMCIDILEFNTHILVACDDILEFHIYLCYFSLCDRRC